MRALFLAGFLATTGLATTGLTTTGLAAGQTLPLSPRQFKPESIKKCGAVAPILILTTGKGTPSVAV